MRKFVLVPGAGGMAWVWSRVAPLLEAANFEVSVVDLPGDDVDAGLPEYSEIVARPIGNGSETCLVALSLAGFVAPIVCERAPVERLVLINAMVPKPGETAGQWWRATGAVQARVEAAKSNGYPTEFNPQTYFLHDLPLDVLKDAPPPREEAETVFSQPCGFERWPDIPIQVLVGSNDRFFPADFQRRVARDRLGLEAHEIDASHLAPLSNPEAVANFLLAGVV